MILVMGTPDSGKSTYSENLSMELFGKEKKAYIATMVPFGEEGAGRVKKHRLMRSGKGFLTYEQPTEVDTLAEVFAREQIHCALLECISNLVGNELYSEKHRGREAAELAEEIVRQITVLDQAMTHLIVVTNQFADAAEYDAETKRYIALTAMVNERLRGVAECVAVKEEDGWKVYENH